LNKIYGFLSITYPVDADVLVIEGWLLQDMFNEAAEEFNDGDYLYSLITGTLDSFDSIWKSIKKAGFRMEDVKIAEVVEKRKHKT